MSTYSKGDQSREEIINRSRALFNENGIHITLSQLAQYLDTTLGRITHHFRNKELLFIGIAQEYENKLIAIRKQRDSGSVNFKTFIQAASQVMDLQYEYRCAIRYIISSLHNNQEMKTHTFKAYENNRSSIQMTIKAHVDAGSLHPKVLHDEFYDVFLFQITNLFTMWVINLELYDTGRSYAEMKPIYLKGIITAFLPFLTEKGKRELESIWNRLPIS